jgi:hypothetical protein
MRGEWGRGKTPFLLIKYVFRVKGGYTQSFGYHLALFFNFPFVHEQGERPSSYGVTT